MKVLIVGGGLYGCTMARLLKDAGHEVEIVEQVHDIGGMCYTYFENDIEVHKFGPHIFHTSDEWVWEFVRRFGTFNNYEHHVLAKHNNKYFCLPFNKMLLEQFFQKTFRDPNDAKQFMQNVIAQDIKQLDIDSNNPKNLEEQAISLVGVDLYNAFIKNYTTKQWNKDPKELSADIIKRIPIRFDYNMSYYDDKYVGIPVNGYSKLIDHMVYGIKVQCCKKMDINGIISALEWFDKVVYTGPLDELFFYKFGTLEWRSLKFETETVYAQSFQGAAAVNYVDADVSYTRINEYKYYHPEAKTQFERGITVIQTEVPQDWDIEKPRFYPVNNAETARIYNEYKNAADSINGLFVGGRLGKYKYYDMDDTILVAKNDAANWFSVEPRVSDFKLKI